MTEARDIAKPLRELMNKRKWTIHDIMRGLVIIANGKLEQEQVITEPQLCLS